MLKNPPLKITVMGSGNSTGVPAVGNYWGSCNPDNPRNRRGRASLCVQSSTTTIAIDTGPEFREQINATGAVDLDAVLYTHEHGDHINGIDDLRIFRLRNKHLIDIYAMPRTMDELQYKYKYLFETQREIYPQIVKPHLITEELYGEVMTVGDISFIPFEQCHGGITSLGFHFGKLAYSTDMKSLDDETIDIIQGVDYWIADGSDYDKPAEMSFVHCTLNDLYDLNEKVQAETVYVTHLTPHMDYDKVSGELPDGFLMCYDGLEINV